jgi:hypothetical protein
MATADRAMAEQEMSVEMKEEALTARSARPSDRNKTELPQHMKTAGLSSWFAAEQLAFQRESMELPRFSCPTGIQSVRFRLTGTWPSRNAGTDVARQGSC